MADAINMWSRYNDEQMNRTNERALASRALEFAGPGNGRRAVDLGCGVGIETRALARSGWDVTAVDSAPGTSDRVSATIDEADLSVRTLETDIASALDGPLATSVFDLVHSSVSLPFVDDFDSVWRDVRRVIAPSGWLAVDLFGDRDDFGQRGIHTVDDDELAMLLDGLDIVDHRMVERDGPAFDGAKHWHVHSVIARSAH